MPVVIFTVRIAHADGLRLRDMDDDIVDALIDELPSEFYYDDTRFTIDWGNIPLMPNLDAVYDILVEECGAHDSLADRRMFAHAWPDCNEYRFTGRLGLGGKIWSATRFRTVHVTCYPEDETPERLIMIENANRRLNKLYLPLHTEVDR